MPNPESDAAPSLVSQEEAPDVHPEPAAVPYNDWRQVAVPAPEAFTPTRPVSVIIPSYQTPPETLAMTLAALETQTYPRDLFEVVIVDDGSEPPVTRPRSTPLDVTVVRQEGRGHGAARARNTGVRTAAHDVLLFLDGDMLPEAGCLAAHARWHHVVTDALTVGFHARVGVDGINAETIRRRSGSLEKLFTGRPVDSSWVEAHMARTHDLTSRADDLFRVVVSNNVGIGRGFYHLLGGFDESFPHCVMEDVELGYRAYTRGGLLVPVRDAFAWHQGRWAEGRAAKDRLLQVQRVKAAHLIAHRQFRSNRPGRIFAVPQYVVTISDAGHLPVHQVIETVANVLADRTHDLVVRVETRPGDDDERLARLRDEFDADPRVRVVATGSALDEFPSASFHVALPAGASAKDLVYRLRVKLGHAVAAVSVLADGSTVSITRAWALHRAHRTGAHPADFGEVRTISAWTLRLTRALHRGTPTRAVDYPTKWTTLRHWAGDVRSPRDMWSLLKGLSLAVQWRTANAWRAGGRSFGRTKG